MKKSFAMLPFLAFVLVVLGGCASTIDPDSVTTYVVNGKEMNRSEAEEWMRQHPYVSPPMPERVFAQVPETQRVEVVSMASGAQIGEQPDSAQPKTVIVSAGQKAFVPSPVGGPGVKSRVVKDPPHGGYPVVMSEIGSSSNDDPAWYRPGLRNGEFSGVVSVTSQSSYSRPTAMPGSLGIGYGGYPSGVAYGAPFGYRSTYSYESRGSVGLGGGFFFESGLNNPSRWNRPLWGDRDRCRSKRH